MLFFQPGDIRPVLFHCPLHIRAFLRLRPKFPKVTRAFPVDFAGRVPIHLQPAGDNASLRCCYVFIPAFREPVEVDNVNGRVVPPFLSLRWGEEKLKSFTIKLLLLSTGTDGGSSGVIFKLTALHPGEISGRQSRDKIQGYVWL